MYPGNYQPQIRMWAQDGNNMIGWLQNLGRQNPLPPGGNGGGGGGGGVGDGGGGGGPDGRDGRARDGGDGDGRDGEEERDDIVRPVDAGRVDSGQKTGGIEGADIGQKTGGIEGADSDEDGDFSSKYDEGKMGNAEDEQPEREEKEQENYRDLEDNLQSIGLSSMSQDGIFKTSQQLLNDIVKRIPQLNALLEDQLEMLTQDEALLDDQTYRINILTLSSIMKTYQSELNKTIPEYRIITDGEFDIEKARIFIPKLLAIIIKFNRLIRNVYDEMSGYRDEL